MFWIFFFGDEFIPPINFGLLSGKRKKQLPGHKDVINKSYGSCNNDRTHNCASDNLCLSRMLNPIIRTFVFKCNGVFFGSWNCILDIKQSQIK